MSLSRSLSLSDILGHAHALSCPPGRRIKYLQPHQSSTRQAKACMQSTESLCLPHLQVM